MTFFCKEYKRKKKRGQTPTVQLTPDQEDDAQLEEPNTPEEEVLAEGVEADAAEAEA